MRRQSQILILLSMRVGRVIKGCAGHIEGLDLSAHENKILQW